VSYVLRNKVAEYGGLTMTQRYILETLALYADDDGTSCRPAIDRVAHDTSGGRKRVWRLVHSLERRSVLVVVDAKPRRPVEYRINLSALPRREAYERGRPTKHDAQRGSTGVTTTPAMGGSTGVTTTPPLASPRPQTGVTVTHNPVSDPVINPVKGAAAPDVITEEGFVKAVVACWRAAREKAGIFKFVDQEAIKNLKDVARRLFAEGTRIDDIRKGIAEHADDPNANPWRGVREWASEARARREALEQRERRMRDRAREDAEWQARS
jgi:hypothetical protein